MPESVYAITEGGPFRRLARALHLVRGDRGDWVRCTAAVLAISYVPLLVAGLVWFVAVGEWLPALTRVTTHTRALVAIPLLLAADRLVEARAYEAGRYVTLSGLLGGPAGLESYRAAIARTARLRDSSLVEGLLLASAIANALADHAYGGAAWHTRASAPAAAVFQFLLLRWLWRWLLWGVLLGRVARLRLVLRATHPDRLAGLGPMLEPAYAFGAVAAACSSVIAGSWSDRVLREQVALSAFSDTALAYGFAVVMLALLPTCVFAPALYRARRIGLTTFSAFANRFATAFDERWMNASGAEALGAAEISLLCDLGEPYAVVDEMKVVPWSPRLVLVLVGWSFAPMVPLVMYELGVPELARRLGGVLL